jgi:hypothetical protein
MPVPQHPSLPTRRCSLQAATFFPAVSRREKAIQILPGQRLSAKRQTGSPCVPKNHAANQELQGGPGRLMPGSVEFIDENGEGAGVSLKKATAERTKTVARIYETNRVCTPSTRHTRMSLP